MYELYLAFICLAFLPLSLSLSLMTWSLPSLLKWWRTSQRASEEEKIIILDLFIELAHNKILIWRLQFCFRFLYFCFAVLLFFSSSSFSHFVWFLLNRVNLSVKSNAISFVISDRFWCNCYCCCFYWCCCDTNKKSLVSPSLSSWNTTTNHENDNENRLWQVIKIEK